MKPSFNSGLSWPDQGTPPTFIPKTVQKHTNIHTYLFEFRQTKKWKNVCGRRKPILPPVMIESGRNMIDRKER